MPNLKSRLEKLEQQAMGRARIKAPSFVCLFIDGAEPEDGGTPFGLHSAQRPNGKGEWVEVAGDELEELRREHEPERLEMLRKAGLAV